MKHSAFLVLVVFTVLKLMNTDAHFKPLHSSLGSPLEHLQPPSAPGQLADIGSSLAVYKTVAFMNFLTSHPKVLCFMPPSIIADFLNLLSCNPSILTAVPQQLLAGFVTTLRANPALVGAIPQAVLLSVSGAASIAVSDANPPPAVLPGTPPGTDIVAVPSPAASPPGIFIADTATAVVTPPNAPPNLPDVAVTKDVSAVITQPVPSTPNAPPNLPGVAVAEKVSVTVLPAVSPSSPAAPVSTADSPATDGISPSNPCPPAALPVTAVPTTVPSVPCNDVPAVPTAPITPPILSPSLLSTLSSLFNKGAGNSVLEAKIESIFKLLMSGNFKLPQLQAPVWKKPTVQVKPAPSQVFVLLPKPLQGNAVNILPTNPKKIYKKPESLHQILDVLHPLPAKPILPTLSLPNLSLPPLSLQPISLPHISLPKPTAHHPVALPNPIKCLPLFSKVPC